MSEPREPNDALHGDEHLEWCESDDCAMLDECQCNPYKTDGDSYMAEFIDQIFD